MHQENRILDLVGKKERRHGLVHLRHFPERAPLALKTERRQRAVVRAALREPGAEEPRMREQIRRHERAVTMTADADAIAIADAHLHHLVDRRFGAGDELLDIMIVGSLARADDRHRRIVEDRVSGQQQEHVRVAADDRELVRRARDLTRRVCIAELAWIRPEDDRQLLTLLVCGRQIERCPERHAVVAFVRDILVRHAAQLRLGILECCDLTRTDPVIWGVLRRLATHQDLRRIVCQRRDRQLVRIRRAVKETLARQRLQTQSIEKRTITFLRRALAD